MDKIERVKQWRKDNPEAYREYQREYMAEKRQSDPSYGKSSDNKDICSSCQKERWLVKKNPTTCRTCYRKGLG